MALIEPEFELMADADKMVADLCDMYPEKLGHVLPSTILCAAITNKEKPDSQAYDASIIGIKSPITLCTEKRYIIHFYKAVWDGKDEAQKAMLIMSKLLRIDEGCDGKVIAEDLKDVKCLVKAFGVDYADNVALPNILQVKQVF